MNHAPEGRAIVYCEGELRTTNGKTAHGLIRRSERYRVLSVIDSTCAGRDAAELLGGGPAGVPVLASVDEGVRLAREAGSPATHLIMGLTPDGGRLPREARADLIRAIELGLHLVSGLHDFLSEDEELAGRARAAGVTLTDVRRPPPRDRQHFFSGVIERVGATRVALLGTDSAVGKRTTAWLLVDELRRRGWPTELIGTGQTAWLQGARYGIILDSLINDFVAGEIEHAVWTAWQEARPRAMVLEGQGSLMNPAYPGGFELLAAGRPQAVVVQHAPGRRDYDGFPGYPVHPLDRQLRAIELISDRPVVAVAVNSEGLDAAGVERACRQIAEETGLPAVEPLRHGVGALVEALAPWLEESPASAITIPASGDAGS